MEKRRNTALPDRVPAGVSRPYARLQVDKLKRIATKDQETAAEYWKYKFISDGKQREWARLSKIARA